MIHNLVNLYIMDVGLHVCDQHDVVMKLIEHRIKLLNMNIDIFKAAHDVGIIDHAFNQIGLKLNSKTTQ